jgi:hypothetical protein
VPPAWRSTRSIEPRSRSSPITGTGSGTLAGSACWRSRSARPNASSKPPRHPAVVGLGRAAEPLAQVGAEARDAVLPDAWDRGPELVLEAPGRLVERAVDVRADGLQVRRSDREQPRVAERRQDRELHLVIERAARQRIERLDGDGVLARLEPHDRLQEERYGHAA